MFRETHRNDIVVSDRTLFLLFFQFLFFVFILLLHCFSVEHTQRDGSHKITRPTAFSSFHRLIFLFCVLFSKFSLRIFIHSRTRSRLTACSRRVGLFSCSKIISGAGVTRHRFNYKLNVMRFKSVF